MSLIVFTGCSKDFLTKPPSSRVGVLRSLPEMTGVLNDWHLFGLVPVVGETTADAYFLVDSLYSGLSQKDKNLYTWQPDSYAGCDTLDDWNIPMRQVSYANQVLEGLANLNPTAVNQDEWTQDKGTALFMRGHAFQQLAMVFAPAYQPATAAVQDGIVLSLNTDQHVVYQRSSMKRSYEQMISDLQAAVESLPVQTDTSLALPGKAAACALLARVYLLMTDYAHASDWADSAILFAPPLVDYNSISPTEKQPWQRLRPEVLYPGTLMPSNVLQTVLKVYVTDTLLYAAYDSNDLRKTLYFKTSGQGQAWYRSFYAAGTFPFAGIGLDEAYLIRAECRVRLGNVADCLDDMNTLLSKRYRTGCYIPVTNASPEDALLLVQNERRKELLFRGLRLADLKRYNAAGANIKLTRRIEGKSYTLVPNSNLYVLPIPSNALRGNAIVQNPR
ncbi:MAG: RagB/SusD family nutrient uptake outer membrane protein [Bacteroidetes bacterium]|nr:RagB/SusD family nutrient uptake outer membrane protein [Bacteroidota bacterium]